MTMNIDDLKTLSKENLNKIHAVIEAIDSALQIGKIEKGVLLIPKANFENRHIEISEVKGVLAKIAKEGDDLIVVVPHENPHPPDKRREPPPSSGDSPFRETFEPKQIRYERDKKIYEDTYSKNIELRIKNISKFRTLSENIEKVVSDGKAYSIAEVGQKVRFDALNAVVRYGDIQHAFHKGERDDAVRLKLFKLLWGKRQVRKNRKVKTKGEMVQAGYLAAQIGISFDASSFARNNNNAKEALKGLIKNTRRVLKDKNIPIRIIRKNGVLLVVEER